LQCSAWETPKEEPIYPCQPRDAGKTEEMPRRWGLPIRPTTLWYDSYNITQKVQLLYTVQLTWNEHNIETDTSCLSSTVSSLLDRKTVLPFVPDLRTELTFLS
jgi:hypothetical protein